MSLASQFSQALKTLANYQVEGEESYKDYFLSWKLVQIKEPMKTSLGLAFDKDEVTIANPEIKNRSTKTGISEDILFTWSFKNQKTVIVPLEFTTLFEDGFKK